MFRNKFPNLIKSGAAKSLFKPDEKKGGDEKDEDEDEGLVMKSMDEDDVDGGASSKQHSPDKEVCQCFTPRPSQKNQHFHRHRFLHSFRVLIKVLSTHTFKMLPYSVQTTFGFLSWTKGGENGIYS